MPRRRDLNVPVRPHNPWDADNAKAKSKTSLTVLLEWLAVPGNYKRWRGTRLGADGQHEKKEALCAEVVLALRENGILHRDNRSVRSKMYQLERFYKAAAEWMQAAGNALLREGGEDAVKQVQRNLKRRCWCFFELDPIFSNPPLWQSSGATALTDNSAPQQTHSSAEPASAPAPAPTCPTYLLMTGSDPELVELQKRKAQTELDILHADLALKRVKLAEENLLARKRLQDAGVVQEEIDTLVPAIGFGSE